MKMESPLETEINLLEAESMKKALENPLILEKIVKELDFIDLRICRLVNSTWTFFANQNLRKKSRIQINNNQQLNSLCDLVEIFPNYFPMSSTISIHNVNVEFSKMVSFFEIYGPDISNLSLCDYAPLQAGNHIQRSMTQMISKNAFRQIFQDLTPNLKCLHLSGRDNYHWGEGEQLIMPTLTQFSWAPSGWTTTLKILQGAANLKIIENTPLHREEVIQLENLGKISTLWTCDLSLLAQESLLELSNFKPKFQNIILAKCPFIDMTGVKDGIQCVLESSQLILKSVTLSDDVISEISIPKLVNVKELVLVMSRTENFLQFNLRDLTEILPHIEILDLRNVNLDSQNYWHWPDDLGQSFQFVHQIKINLQSKLQLVHEVGRMCPNAKILTISSHNETFDETILTRFLATLESIWNDMFNYAEKFVTKRRELNFGLEELELEIPSVPHKKFWLESTLMDVPQKNSIPIREMTDLKKVRIHFMDKPLLPFSRHCSHQMAKVMAHVKLVIQFDHQQFNDQVNEMYNELGSCVNIHHVKNSRVVGDEQTR